jgi:hypothetical protein
LLAASGLLAARLLLRHLWSARHLAGNIAAAVATAGKLLGARKRCRAEPDQAQPGEAQRQIQPAVKTWARMALRGWFHGSPSFFPVFMIGMFRRNVK